MHIIDSKISIFENRYFLFPFLIAVIVINLISSIHFLNILIIGVVFVAYTQCLASQNYNLLIYIVPTMLFIELNNGFKPFSIILIGSFIYVYLIPFLTKIVILDLLGDTLKTILLYIGIALLWSFSNDFNLSLVKIILFNLILDIFIIKLLP